MLRSSRLQSRQVAGRARGAGLPAPGLAEGRAHCGANRVGACCGEGQGAEQAHLAGEEGRSSRSPMDQKTYNNRSVTRSGGSRNVFCEERSRARAKKQTKQNKKKQQAPRPTHRLILDLD